MAEKAAEKAQQRDRPLVRPLVRAENRPFVMAASPLPNNSMIFSNDLRARGIEVAVAKAHLPLRETMSAGSETVATGSEHYEQLAAAVAALRFQSEAE